jgi:arginine utilization regulatory protein
VDEAQAVALHGSDVLILGETGTGKELFAQGIHNYSQRAESLFVAIDCAAIPETLLESTLFGTVRGAYTGATDQMGLF